MINRLCEDVEMLKLLSITTLWAVLSLPTMALAEDIVKEPAPTKQAMRAMLHANPVPNYMAILRQAPADMKLSDEQKSKLDEWYQGHNDQSQEAVKKIIEAEKSLAQASLDGMDKVELMNKADELLAMRRALIEQKTNCRDYVRTVLSPEQWAQLTELQKQAIAKRPEMKK